MKAYKVLLFMVGVFALLALIGLVMPKDGIRLGKGEKKLATLRFVSPKDILMGESEEEHYVAEVDSSLVMDSAELAKMDESEKMKYEVVAYENAITFPGNDPAWMDEVFAALNQADHYPIRIIHYGDSQIEIDRITSDLRHMMQSEFGGYGVGMIPAIQTVPTTAISQRCNRELKRYIVYGIEGKLKSRQYGPMGQTAELNGNATFTFSQIGMKGTKPGTKRFGRIGILYENAENVRGEITAGGKKYPFELPADKNFVCIVLGDSTTRAEVKMQGKALLHGFLLDGNGHGVNVDNVAMRGCSGTIFTSINAESMRSYFGRFNVPLIIMQFGGNAMSYLKPGKSIHTYLNGLRNQIAYLKRLSPGSKILFIGPSDMATKVNGKMQSYPQLPVVVDSLKQMCQASDIAFWDLYSAMGGWNSMVGWVHSSPQLAGPDYVHFTTAGASRASKLLTNAIAKTYEYYIMRNPDVQYKGNLKSYEIETFDGSAWQDGFMVVDSIAADTLGTQQPDSIATSGPDTI